ncbi:muramidase family protein [Winogradskyella pulchriflava]|uniref:LysM peptidoglycan-binding domain-containing protein n=1 Tax=Winogradskyella pulchriflava TaxID=1110688 RepID=A0ABV6Q956_9FLAO
MQRNYKLILSIVVVLLSGLLAFSQEAGYKDVILDGKPAKLNIATGEITFVNTKDKKRPVQLDAYVASTTKTADNDSTPELDSDYHIVKDGETLFEIANLYNTSLTELKQANGLETTLVDKGQKLRVKNFENLEHNVVDNSSEPLVSKNNNNFHTVEKGQTLYSLAKQYNITVDELKQQNKLTSNIIKVGQKLRVSNFDSNVVTNNLSVWTVSKGDTLYSIAKKNGITVQQLKDLNGLTDNLIKVGQKLHLE